MEFQCPVIVQRHSASSCGSPVQNIPLQAERHSGGRQKLFAFPAESAFTFRPECCSESQRNGVQLQTGIAFAFDRIPQPSIGSLTSVAPPAPAVTYHAAELVPSSTRRTRDQNQHVNR